MKFQKGLKFSIRNKIVPLRLQSYDDMLATAQLIEQDLEQQKQEVENHRGKGKATSVSPKTWIKPKKG